MRPNGMTSLIRRSQEPIHHIKMRYCLLHPDAQHMPRAGLCQPLLKTRDRAPAYRQAGVVRVRP
jgi:hypothetical protein